MQGSQRGLRGGARFTTLIVTQNHLKQSLMGWHVFVSQYTRRSGDGSHPGLSELLRALSFVQLQKGEAKQVRPGGKTEASGRVSEACSPPLLSVVLISKLTRTNVCKCG